MSADLEGMKKRRDLMLKVNGIALVIGIAAIVAKFKFQVWWALYALVVALLIGFAAQCWFVWSITSTDKPKKKSSAARPQPSKGA